MKPSPKVPRSNKDSRAAADAAYLASQQMDLMTAAIPSLSNVTEATMIATVPDACPACSHRMSLGSGWTALSATTAGHGVLQCGFCGHSISVPTPVYESYRGQLRQLADERAARVAERQPKKRDGGRRTRGAG